LSANTRHICFEGPQFEEWYAMTTVFMNYSRDRDRDFIYRDFSLVGISRLLLRAILVYLHAAYYFVRERLASPRPVA
jgi:hypothetical protein